MNSHNAEMINGIPTFTRGRERSTLRALAKEVPAKGRILEIGTFFGGTTSVLALSNPKAKVYTIDNYSWKAPKLPMGTMEQNKNCLYRLGIRNVEWIQGDSKVLVESWNKKIDLLWVDGDHSYEGAFADLANFGPFSFVIALHDYGNDKHPGVKKAVEDFLFVHPQWKLDKVVDTVAILRRGV